MTYTVGQMAKMLGLAGSRCDITIKKAFFPLWNVLPAVSGCFGRKTTNGCRSSNV